MFLKLLQYLLNSLYIFFTFAFDVDKDVIKVHFHKKVKLLC